MQPDFPQPAAALAPPPRFVYVLFLGPEGLRAGWRFLLYLAMGGFVFWLLVLTLRLMVPRRIGFLWGQMITELVLLVAALLPALVMARIEGRPFGVYGLPRRGAFGKLFWIGMLGGIVSLTVLMLALDSVRVFDFGHIVLHGMRMLKFAAFYAVFFLVVGFFEEFVTRGYSQFTLTRGMGFWPAAVLLSLAFGSIHLGNSGEGVVGALSAGFIGFFLCLTLRRTGDLWFAVGFHCSFDWGETFLYSVPNSGTTAPGHLLSASFHGPTWLSGGTVGPEGSVLCFVLMAAMWIVFDRTYREARYPA